MDILKKYLAHNDMVRVSVINGTDMIKKARDIHFLSNVATAALGRTMLASTMIASNFKEKNNRLTVRIKGEGDLKNIIVCGDNSLKMKGYVANPYVDLPLKSNGKLDVSTAVGKGTLSIIKDIGMNEPYIGTCNLITSEIAEDFAYYFVTSEQTPCAISLGVNISKENDVGIAVGYIIEPLPDCDDKVINILELINENIESVTNLMLDIGNIDDVAKTITGDNNIKCIYEKKPVYECDCNNDRIVKTIIAMGKKDSIDALNNNNGILELTCSFCNKVYRFNREQLESIFNK